MRIAICDDDAAFVEKTEQKLKSILSAEQRTYKITAFTNGKALIEMFKNQAFDVVFLDVDMPVKDGFETAEELQKIKPDVNIVFITSHEDKVFQSYEYHPFWFVRKSHMEDLDIVLSKLLVKIDSMREKEHKKFNLITNARVIELDICNVQYILARDHYIIITDSDNKRTTERCKISDAESQLSPLHFVRVQNSVIVNCRFISKVNSREVILLDGKKINISRGKVEYVKNEFQKYIRSI